MVLVMMSRTFLGTILAPLVAYLTLKFNLSILEVFICSQFSQN